MRRRVLPVLLVLTALVLLADLAGAPLGPLRGVGDQVLGPVERLVAPGPDETDRLEQDNLRLDEQVRRLEDRAGVADQVGRLDSEQILRSPWGNLGARDRARLLLWKGRPEVAVVRDRDSPAGQVVGEAVRAYRADVLDGAFPAPEHGFEG